MVESATEGTREDMPDSKQELHRFQTLLDAARLLNSTLELKEVTQIILDVVRAEVEVERVSVFVVDRAGKTLHSLVAQEVEDIDLMLPIGKGIAGTVAATGEVLDVPDAYADLRFDRRFDQKLQFYTHDIFALPVYDRQGDIVGVLELLNRAREITNTDREFLFGISVYIGLALQNAWSHAQVRKKGEHQHELFSLRDDLAETEQLSLTSELFQHVVQEISNPLADAISYAELARNLEPLPKELRAYLEKITQGLDRTATALDSSFTVKSVNVCRYHCSPCCGGSVTFAQKSGPATISKPHWLRSRFRKCWPMNVNSSLRFCICSGPRSSPF
jgi:signal transduction protein with GAF and PtsI domain